MKKKFLVESFSGEVYEKNFSNDDSQKFFAAARESQAKKESSKVETVTDPLRLFNRVDIDRESVQAVDSNYKLSGDFVNIFSRGFSGKIFGNI